MAGSSSSSRGHVPGLAGSLFDRQLTGGPGKKRRRGLRPFFNFDVARPLMLRNPDAFFETNSKLTQHSRPPPLPQLVLVERGFRRRAHGQQPGRECHAGVLPQVQRGRRKIRRREKGFFFRRQTRFFFLSKNRFRSHLARRSPPPSPSLSLLSRSMTIAASSPSPTRKAASRLCTRGCPCPRRSTTTTMATTTTTTTKTESRARPFPERSGFATRTPSSTPPGRRATRAC